MIHHIAKLAVWRDAGVGSPEATKLCIESAQSVDRLRMASARLTAFVDCTCTSAKISDIGLAIQADAADATCECDVFDKVPWGVLVQRTSALASSMQEEIVQMWLANLQSLTERLKPSFIEWESQCENLLLPAQQELCYDYVVTL